jgi:hypothetical protein
MQSFEELSYGDEIRYVGPEPLPGEYVAPTDWTLPYSFRCVYSHGSLGFYTKHNERRHYAPDHPANNPAFWEVVE